MTEDRVARDREAPSRAAGLRERLKINRSGLRLQDAAVVKGDGPRVCNCGNASRCLPEGAGVVEGADAATARPMDELVVLRVEDCARQVVDRAAVMERDVVCTCPGD